MINLKNLEMTKKDFFEESLYIYYNLTMVRLLAAQENIDVSFFDEPEKIMAIINEHVETDDDIVLLSNLNKKISSEYLSNLFSKKNK